MDMAALGDRHDSVGREESPTAHPPGGSEVVLPRGEEERCWSFCSRTCEIGGSSGKPGGPSLSSE